MVATSPLLVQHEPGSDAVIGADPVGGDVFILKPHPGDLDPAGNEDGRFRLLLQVDSRKYGVNAKIPGVVTADRATGRVGQPTIVRVGHDRWGVRAVVAGRDALGRHRRPRHPGCDGVLDTQAGSSSPLTFDLGREDRSDVINGLNVSLPGGLLAAIKNVALCSDVDADAGSCPVASRIGSASVAAGAGAAPFYLSGAGRSGRCRRC